MKAWFAGILLILFAMIPAGCAQPIGTVYDKSSGTGTESMFIVPKRVLYQIDERFDRIKDFQIFIVEGGTVVELLNINNQTIEVYITSNKDLSTEWKEEVRAQEHPFYTIGTHWVDITLLPGSGYSTRSGSYSVEVYSPNNGNGSEGDGGIGIIWL